ncbi:hypothetical protein Ssi02_66260 [Sinosporangium siamense]|uniref:Uncharacterized protein n=1 Tax=Sinosporangium siamense TaxID=1367973 RepID=A0A919RP16_9ACTN|nr:hypothetical protein Ssi02_66260 [Sinosporangium siamense]
MVSVPCRRSGAPKHDGRRSGQAVVPRRQASSRWILGTCGALNDEQTFTAFYEDASFMPQQ